jgi:transcriptional regulator with XRE-family HTH domain
MIITSPQIRAARALLGWTQAELAEASGLSAIGIQAIEKGTSDPRASTLLAIESAFKEAGVVFTNGGEPGVKIVFVRTSCDKCGLKVKVSATETTVIDPASRCKNRKKPLACPELRTAVSSAHQILRKV